MRRKSSDIRYLLDVFIWKEYERERKGKARE